jgi:hypothetical protein
VELVQFATASRFACHTSAANLSMRSWTVSPSLQQSDALLRDRYHAVTIAQTLRRTALCLLDII